MVDFALFRAELDAALARSDRAKGGRPPYDLVLMFKVLVLQTLYTLSDDQTEYQIRDRLSFMRFLGLALEDRGPDAKTIWLFREQLTRSGAVERLFQRFEAVLREAGYLAMGGADRGCHRHPGPAAQAQQGGEGDRQGRRPRPQKPQPCVPATMR